MGAKFSEAFRLLGRNLWLYAAIILTVWIPGNILIEYVVGNAESAVPMTFLVSSWVSAIFGPIYVGALIFALFRIKSGQPVTYGEAIAVGFKKWGVFFLARLAAGILILLGLALLIVPGLILAVRYSLLDEAVILENKGPLESKSRSVELTAGRRWKIFGAAALFCIVYMFISVVMGAIFGLAGLDSMLVNVILSCVLDIISFVLYIVMFLFYWEATQDRRNAEPAAGADSTPVSAQL
jgi:hypothetical protein